MKDSIRTAEIRPAPACRTFTVASEDPEQLAGAFEGGTAEDRIDAARARIRSPGSSASRHFELAEEARPALPRRRGDPPDNYRRQPAQSEPGLPRRRPARPEALYPADAPGTIENGSSSPADREGRWEDVEAHLKAIPTTSPELEPFTTFLLSEPRRASGGLGRSGPSS